jgi:hypothetical protein
VYVNDLQLPKPHSEPIFTRPLLPLSFLRTTELLGDVLSTQVLGRGVGGVSEVSSVDTVSMGSVTNTVTLSDSLVNYL